MAHISVFDKTEQKTMHWIKSTSANMGSTDMQRPYPEELRELWPIPGM